MAQSAALAIKITADASQAAAALDKTAGKTDKFKSGMATAGKVAAGALVGVAAAAISAGKAAAEDAQSQALLANAMKNATGANKAAIDSMEDWISKTSMATGVADDELRPALGALVRATGDAAKSQQAMAIALDVAAATGKDVGAVSTALAKGYAGQTTAIGRLVPGMDKAILASGDMEKITAELARTTGGAAATAADTAAGKMKIMQVSMDEAKESIGAALLPVMEKLATTLATVAAWIQDNATKVQILVAVLAGLAVAVIAVNAAMKVAAALTTAFSVAQGIAAVVTRSGTTALQANKVAMAAYNATSKIAAAVTWLFNAALSANPISLVVIAVAALIAGMVALYRNSETVRKVVDKLWEILKSVATSIWNTVKPAFDAIGNAIGVVVDAVQDLIGWLGKIKVPKISLPKIPGIGGNSVAVPVAGATTRGATTTAGGAVYNFNISGAVDPEAVARQIKRIVLGHEVRIGLAT